MKKSIPYIIIGIFGMAAGMTISCCPEKQTIVLHDMEAMEALQDYHTKCEALLDSIYKEDKSFSDTWEETDTYQDYWLSKRRVDSLFSESCPY